MEQKKEGGHEEEGGKWGKEVQLKKDKTKDRGHEGVEGEVGGGQEG